MLIIAWYGADSSWSICNKTDYLDINCTGKTSYLFDHIVDDTQSGGPDGTIVYGLYRIYVRQNGSYFFLDWRDSDYHDGNGQYGTGYYSPDMSIRYNSGWEYKDSLGTFNSISDGDTIKVWEAIKNYSTYPMTGEHFTPSVPTNLSISYISNRPRLSWDLSDPKNDASYVIYRKICGPPRFLNCSSYSVVANVTPGSTSWDDNEFNVSANGDDKAYYKMKAKSGDGNRYSEYTSEIVTSPGDYVPNDRHIQINTVKIDNDKVCTIHPNPFNSQVLISFSNSNASIKSARIYDVKGKLIYSLNIIPNQHRYNYIWDATSFNGSHIESGVYFLVVKSNKDVLFKEKMIYLK